MCLNLWQYELFFPHWSILIFSFGLRCPIFFSTFLEREFLGTCTASIPPRSKNSLEPPRAITSHEKPASPKQTLFSNNNFSSQIISTIVETSYKQLQTLSKLLIWVFLMLLTSGKRPLVKFLLWTNRLYEHYCWSVLCTSKLIHAYMIPS